MSRHLQSHLLHAFSRFGLAHPTSTGLSVLNELTVLGDSHANLTRNASYIVVVMNLLNCLKFMHLIILNIIFVIKNLISIVFVNYLVIVSVRLLVQLGVDLRLTQNGRDEVLVTSIHIRAHFVCNLSSQRYDSVT